MANLLPTTARSNVTREYWLRVATAWLLLVGTATFMVTTLQIPSYVLLTEQSSGYDAMFAEVSSDNEQFESAVASILETNEISRLLGENPDAVHFTDLINELNRLANRDIELSSIRVARESGVVETISVSGDANTRSALVGFRAALEASEFFTAAELPFSNFAKDNDIPFTITISTTAVESDDV